MAKVRPPPPTQQPAQVHALEELHDDEAVALVLAVFVNGTDPGMPHLARDLDLGAEAAAGLLGLGQVGTQDLERHILVERAVEGAVHRSHSALPQDGPDLVAPAQHDTAAERHRPQLVPAVEAGVGTAREGLGTRRAGDRSRGGHGVVKDSAGRPPQGRE